MGNQRFGFYGFFGAIALALLASKLMGCASPASAQPETVKFVDVTHTETPDTIRIDPDLGIIGLLDLPPGEYIADTDDVYVDGETTITVEDTHITIY